MPVRFPRTYEPLPTVNVAPASDTAAPSRVSVKSPRSIPATVTGVVVKPPVTFENTSATLEAGDLVGVGSGMNLAMRPSATGKAAGSYAHETLVPFDRMLP